MVHLLISNNRSTAATAATTLGLELQ